MRKVSNDTFEYEMEFPIIDGDFNEYQYKFVINGSDWRINDKEPKKDDGKGNINNYFSVGIPNKHEHKLSPALKIEKEYPDIRYARRILNEVHELSTSNNAEIFLH